MRLAFSICLFCVLQSFAIGTFSQNVRLSINQKNISVESALQLIEDKTDYYFMYSALVVDVKRTVDIEATNKLVPEILNDIFKGTDTNFKIDGRLVALSKNGEISPISQQSKSVSGKVTDITGGPLPGVSVVVKGTTTGTITDTNGNYSLSNIPSNGTLRYSFVGMKTQEILVSGRTNIDVVMEDETVGIEEVVAIGYGTQSKKDISGSITVISEKNFNVGANQSALELIQGKVSGLSINTTSSDVTSGPSVFLRGISSLSGAVSPFYVIDGVPGMDLNLIPPQDIESISVLKDASATAIYGSRAASGVILVTTKKGKAGQTSIEYSGKAMAGFSSNTPPVLNASEYREYATKIGMDISASDKGANTDWFKEITKEGRISQEHYISLSGGSEKSNYRVSGKYLNNQGLVNKNYLERYNFLFSYSQKALNDKLDISFSGGANKENTRGISSYGNIFSILPIWPVKNPDGTWWEAHDINGGNPVHSLAENKALWRGYSMYFNMKANLEIIKDFYAGANLYTTRQGSENDYYNAMTTAEGINDHGSATKNSSIYDKSSMELTLKYLKKIDKHNFEVLGGYSYEHNQNQFTNISVRGFITDIFGYDNLSAADITKVRTGDFSSGGDMSKLIGFFGRLNYNFSDKYILSATMRHDGSSKFGDNNKWGNFPSLSVAWNLTEESFMSRFKALNELKLRLGYGVTGNQDGIGPYNSLALYSSGSLYYNNGAWENTYQYSQNPNPNLKWEQTSTLNAGIDYSFYKNRIYGSVDYYVRKTSDLLYTYPVPVPPYLYGSLLANVGDISNKGIELVINADVIRKKDFRWTVSFNVAHNKQQIDKLSNDEFKIQNTMVGWVTGRGMNATNTSILREGEEISTFYGPKCLGLDKDGMYIIEDVNKDGTIDSQDNQVIGHAMPKATYGFSNTLTYKGFDFSFFLRGVYGNDILNNDKLQMGNPSVFPRQVYQVATTTPLRDMAAFNSYYIEKGSFLRLQNASLGYNINTKNYIGIKTCKVYMAGENLFVLTKYSGMDPEIAAFNGSQGILAQGIDSGGSAPLIRRVIFGVSIVF